MFNMAVFKIIVVLVTLAAFIALCSYAYGYAEAHGLLNNYGGPVHIVRHIYCGDDYLSQLTCK